MAAIASHVRSNIFHKPSPGDAASSELRLAAQSWSRLSSTEAQELFDASNKAAMAESAEETCLADEIQPDGNVLRKPSRALTNQGQLLLLMTKMGLLSNSMATQELKNRLAIFAAQSESQANQAAKLSAELDKMSEDYDAVYSDAEQALDTATAAKESLDKARQNLAGLKDELAALKKAKPSDDNKDKIAKLEQQITAGEKDVAAKKQQSEVASQNALDKQATAEAILNKYNIKTEEMNKKFANVGSGLMNGAKTAAEHSESVLNASGMMIKILATFIQKLGESSVDKLQADLEINNKRAAARQADMTRKADEYAEQVRKAEEAEKTSGCIGKILGGLAIAIGAITTIFGGGGLALMAVGIGLMAADAITEAITGESLTGMIMNPIMEYVINPLMNIVGDIITKLIDISPLGLLLKEIEKATGAKILDTLHTVVIAAVTIAAVVAIAMVAKSAAKFAFQKLGKVMTSALVQSAKAAISQAVKKMLPQFVKNGARQVSALASKAAQAALKKFSKVASKISSKFSELTGSTKNSTMKALRINSKEEMQSLLQTSMHRLNYVEQGLQVTKAGVQAGFNIKVAKINEQIAHILSGFKLAERDLDIMRGDVERALAIFQKEEDFGESLREQIINIVKNKHATGMQILRNVTA